MKVKIYSSLPPEARLIREQVFVKEQGFCEEFDDVDAAATHLVLFNEEEPVATCRFFLNEEKGAYILGRIAVQKEYRGQKLGTYVLRAAEEEIRKQGGGRISLHAQEGAAGFYEKQGYDAHGEIEYEESCPHIWMSKNLVSTLEKC